ncbi:MAG: glutamate formimidoyltransferase [Candidatus Bipolaricaulota bacterium]
MWERLVECVPNVSEGRRQDVIDEIADAIRGVQGVILLDVDSDEAHNRSVFTMVSEPEGLERAVLAFFRAAVSRIDLRGHQGEHPRMGAVDVVPVVPVRGVSMADCVELSGRLGQAIWKRFEVPVYLYEESAAEPGRRNLANIRRGQFEGFPEKIQQEAWGPDFGERRVHPSAGVCAVGAREFLIAFNVNLGTSELETAQEIARAVRGSSGGFHYVKALGVELAERGIVQVTMNLTNYKKSPIPRVLECIRLEAARRGVPVVGSEIVGMVPQAALDAVVEYYTSLEDFRGEMVLDRRVQQLTS